MQTKLPYKFSITFLKKNVNVSKYGAYKPINMVTKLAMTNTHTHTLIG